MAFQALVNSGTIKLEEQGMLLAVVSEEEIEDISVSAALTLQEKNALKNTVRLRSGTLFCFVTFAHEMFIC